MYKASNLVSGTWQNVSGPTASWQSSQSSTMRGFIIFVDGYGDENNGASIYYQGSYYYEWGYVFKDTDLDGLFEINSTYEDVLGDEYGFTYSYEGYDEFFRES